MPPPLSAGTAKGACPPPAAAFLLLSAHEGALGLCMAARGPLESLSRMSLWYFSILPSL